MTIYHGIIIQIHFYIVGVISNMTNTIQDKIEQILKEHQSTDPKRLHRLQEIQNKINDFSMRGLLKKQEYKPLPKFDFRKYYYDH